MLDAAALLDAALHGAKGLPPTVSDDLRLDRAALGLEAGVARRDGRLLDQAGRDLRMLVESASPDYRPLTRARALALAGAGLMALARLAKDEAATVQGQALFAAAGAVRTTLAKYRSPAARTNAAMDGRPCATRS